jgi:hypothetical protein
MKFQEFASLKPLPLYLQSILISFKIYRNGFLHNNEMQDSNIMLAYTEFVWTEQNPTRKIILWESESVAEKLNDEPSKYEHILASFSQYINIKTQELRIITSSVTGRYLLTPYI